MAAEPLPVGVLHAAGVGDKGLLAEVAARRVQWVHAPKAVGGWLLACVLGGAAPESWVVFSSVAAALGNVGQASYSSANAWLDAHTLSRRGGGAAACSLQWPLVGGAGMGADAFGALAGRQTRVAGLAGISLE